MTMARRSNQMAPIVSNKKYFQTGFTAPTGAENTFNITLGVAPGAVGVADNTVRVGANIFRVRVQLSAGSVGGGSLGSIHWYIGVARAGQDLTAGTGDFPSPAALVGSLVRNQILQSYQKVLGSEDGNTYHFDRWIKIPKIYRRVREGDVIFVKILNSGSGSQLTQLETIVKDYT